MKKLWYKPEGFKDFIQQMKDEGMSLPMYVNHQSMDVPIGKWTELKITDIGLVAKGEMFDTSKAKDVSTVMRDGSILRSVSITAYPMDYAYENMTFLTEDGEEDLENGKYLSFKKASVAEVSIVDQPANKQTKILSIEKRSLESKLRSIEGVSKALAKKNIFR